MPLFTFDLRDYATAQSGVTLAPGRFRANGIDFRFATRQAEVVQRTFGIVEIAETILLHLPTSDLLRSQRVCRQWRAVALGSTPIRKALFLIPGEARHANVDDARLLTARDIGRVRGYGAARTKLQGDVAFNPLLVLCLPKPPARRPKWKEGHDDHDHDDHDDDGEGGDDDQDDDADYDHPTHDKLNLPMLHANLLSTHTSASCRRMFITQPPLQFRNLAFDRMYESRGNGRWRTTRFLCDVHTHAGQGRQLKELIEGLKCASPGLTRAVLSMVRGSWTFELC